MKLELARTLFLMGEYRESRALFREVQLEPEVPWQVRDNIELFVQRIDDIVGYVKFGFSVVSDSNPLNITREREFTIGGVRLTFVPPEDSKRVTGIRYGVRAHQPLARAAGVSAYFTGSYLDYPTEELDRLTIDAGLVKDLGGPKLRAGIEAGTYGGQGLYRFPYLGYLRPLSQSPEHSLAVELKLGRVTFPDYRYLDARYVSGTVSGVRALSQTLAASLALTGETSRAREEPYSYYGVTLTPGVTWLVGEPPLLVKADLAFAQRRYAEPDPLFGVKRIDDRIRLDLALRSKQWRWMNFSPAVVLSLEKTESSNAFYSYEKTNLSLAVE